MLTAGRFAATAVSASAIAGMLIAGLSGCQSELDQPERGIYRLPISAPGGEIDPMTAADPFALAITGLVTEPLISLDAEGALRGRVAEAWFASDDGLTWTVVLREGVEFNDGTPLTSRDVVFTFDTLTADATLSPGGMAFSGILDSVHAASDLTVEFDLVRPFSDFPLLLTGANTGIVPEGYRAGTWLEDPVGAGQFVLTEYSPSRGATYEKNQRYWNADEIELDGVELKIYPDAQGQLLAFQADEIDRTALTSEAAAAVDLALYDIVSTGYNRFDGVFFDVTEPPFDDVEARQAVAWAIDRPALIERVYLGAADVANDMTFFPDYKPSPSNVEQRFQDLDRVTQLLDGRTLSFTITTSYQLLGEVLQQQLNAIPGFDVALDVLSSEEYYADGEASPWLHAPVTATSWGKRAPSQFITMMYGSGAEWNASRFASEELDVLIAEFDETTDDARRQQLADEIGRLQWEEVPVVIPAFSASRALQSKRVTGELIGPIDFYTGYDLAGIAIEE
ncbi:ABC transporter substrate-binding protein [Microbacterium koreense]|uniref:ABC transporter substrate-binding protein n=1 Tax=Microbacterium koreense TaxID=323761 RepID=A0ABW2ZMP5_9MICO